MSKDLTYIYQNKVIKIDLDGAESRIGMLLNGSEDYIAVLTDEDEVIYYKTKHINGTTENMKGKMKFDVKDPEDVDYIEAENFKDLLEQLKYSWVGINRDYPKPVEGILVEVKDDYVYLVTCEEITRISMSHIKNVSD
ncbi:hypothetical protein [Neobacillus vireti]|uniref:hypothetical protein n=1 Tax=Neobacillus vireti TaxID=220686 RepID=UPI002FFF22D4